MTETEVYPGDLVIVENSSAWGIDPEANVVEISQLPRAEPRGL